MRRPRRSFVDSPRVASFEQSDPIPVFAQPDFRTAGGQAEARLDDVRGASGPAGKKLAGEKVAAADRARNCPGNEAVASTVQEKFNGAFAVLSFAILGVPLGIKVSRRETSANLGLAVLLALGYYFSTVAIGWLDHHPEYRPDMLLWIPNLLMTGLGIWLFSRVDRK